MTGVWNDWLNRLRDFGAPLTQRFRPPYPPVALALDAEGLGLVRVARHRGGRAVLEGHALRPGDGAPVGSIFDHDVRQPATLPDRLRELFALSGTRPGRASLVLPDNLAKISLLQLPERPGSSRHLDELVRSRMRRAVPFRLEDARIAYQVMPGEGREVGVLVIMVRRGLVEGWEQALGQIGVRLGLVDLCTPNLVNLVRRRIEDAAEGGADVAVFNATPGYFSLVILRAGRLIFFRCKTLGSLEGGKPNGELLRELSGSLSYYREKLGGSGIAALFVRSAGISLADLAGPLGALEVGRIEKLDPLADIALGSGRALDEEAAQRLAPALGAALGRGN